ncbi:MAG TPA: exopolysaccharide biosynthesis polyprenyl glycosylphosphotransferase [Ignavibacteriaceae bacterium]|nr:exopolysaccharide biosynthesis polyprenyl glycosylphosphotransferase [Ignavibacteriaceae bacterium]
MLTNRKSYYYLRLFLDLTIINLSFITAAVIAQSFEILIVRTYMFILLAVLNFLWYFFSNVINFYDEFTTRYYSFQIISIFKISLALSAASVLFIFLTKEDLFTRNFILIFTSLTAAAVSLRIVSLKYLLVFKRRREKQLKNLLILGAEEVGVNFSKRIIERTDLGYNVIGFLDDSDKKKDVIKILGSVDDLEKILSTTDIELVVVALPLAAYTKLESIIAACNKHAARIYIIPDYFKFVSKKFQISMFGNIPLIAVREEPLSEFHWRFLKRSADIVISSISIVFILSWLTPLIAILNLIYNRGPVFFFQKRYGVQNKLFNCMKYRTMVASKEDEFVPVVENDPRITKLGRFLRRSNIDELPQFINVLKGEMSVVGPRPHSIPFNEIYKDMVNELKIRSWVKPGITGWAQINGLRGDVPDFEENKKRTIKRIENDLWYIENWSFWLDVQIILLTIWQMIKGETKGI